MHIESQRDCDLLIIASHAPDMADLRPYLSNQLINEVQGIRVRGKAVRLGVTVTKPGTTHGILAVEPRTMLLIGSYDVYPNMPQYHPHDVILSSHVQLVDHSVITGRNQFPRPMQTSFKYNSLLGTELTADGKHIFITPIANPLAKTTDDTVAASVHPSSGYEAENLEAFTVGQACKAAEVPFYTMLNVSNIIGSTRQQDWMQFQRATVNATTETIMTWIQRDAQDLPHG